MRELIANITLALVLAHISGSEILASFVFKEKSPAQCSPATSARSDQPLPLAQEDLHRLEVEGRGKGLEEIVAHHAGEMEAQTIFPWERPIVKSRDIVFPHLPK